MSTPEDVAGAIEAQALWHLIKAGVGQDHATDHEDGRTFLHAFALYVRELPDTDARLVHLEALHLELPGVEYFYGPAAQATLRWAHHNYEAGQFGDLLAVLVGDGGHGHQGRPSRDLTSKT